MFDHSPKLCFIHITHQPIVVASFVTNIHARASFPFIKITQRSKKGDNGPCFSLQFETTLQ